MKVFVVSNLFQPEVLGGYEIGCSQVVESLREAGQDIEVLTSTMVPQMGRDYVHPLLDCSIWANLRDMPRLAKLRYLVQREKQNLRVFQEVLRTHKPDVIYFWNLGHTSRCLIQVAKQSGIPIGLFAFDLGLLSDENDLWTSQSRFIAGSPGRFAQALILRVAGAFMGRPAGGIPTFDFIHSPTRFIERKLQAGGLRSKNWEQIPWGVDTEVFHPAEQMPRGNILFTGQVAEHKGVHLLIEALSRLVSRHRPLQLHLTIAGPLFDKDYKSRLDALVLEKGLSAHVTFAGRVERTDLPDLYRRHSIYVFPSLWEEPMGIGVLEAMASGLAVVCSGTGGSGELFEDGQSGLKFRNGDPIDLANKINFLLTNFEDSAKISQQAVEVCLLKYRFYNFLDTIRNLLINRYLKE
jgi:glycogen(starch) synthase